MGTIREDVFLGTTEKYNQKLEMLAKMAQPEKWTYKKIRDSDPYRILRNYICKLNCSNKMARGSG